MAHWRPRMPKPVCPSCGQDRAIRRGGGLCLSCDKQQMATPQFDRICPNCGDVVYAGRRACECQNYLAYNLPSHEYSLSQEERVRLRLLDGLKN